MFEPAALAPSGLAPAGRALARCGQPAGVNPGRLCFSNRDACQFIPLVYDYQRLAREMEEEGLPSEFVATIRTGWWTTCMEIMPAKERLRGRF